MNTSRYAVVVEKGTSSFGAYVPDLPGCVAVADTKDEVEKLIAEAITFHIEGLILSGIRIPEPSSEVGVHRTRSRGVTCCWRQSCS